IEALLIKIPHDMLELTFPHLPMGDMDTCFRQKPGQLLKHVLNGADFVVKKINLPTSLQFTQARFAYNAFRKWMNKGFNGQPSLWRGRDNGKIPQPVQRHR